MVELKISGVSCRYDSAPALDGVELVAGGHELVAILGPNGSGKTTLLRAISRVLRPVVGAVFVDGREVYDMKPLEVAQKVAVVPQDSVVGFDFTALEIVLMGRNPYLRSFAQETREDVRIAEQAMALTNCAHLTHRRFHELSGGEKRRLIIARALAQEPHVLLLDEPTLNLDVSHQIELLDSIRALSQARGFLVLSVFHDFNLAARYADRVILLNEGKVSAVGPPEVVLTAENLRGVFRVNAEVSRHPVTKLNVVIDSVFTPEKHTHYSLPLARGSAG